MSNTRMFNVSQPKPKAEGQEKTYWHNIGVAFENPNGSIKLVLDSLPMPDRDILLFPREEEKEERDTGKGSGKGSRR